MQTYWTSPMCNAVWVTNMSLTRVRWTGHRHVQVSSNVPDKVKSPVKLFANDTADYLAITKLPDSEQLQADVDILQEWETSWGVQFNHSKCVVIQIIRSGHSHATYTLHGEILEEVTCTRNHVDISSYLSWKTHVMLLQCGALIQRMTYKNRECTETGGPMCRGGLLPLLKCHRHYRNTRMAYPRAAAYCVTNGPIL